MDYKSVLILGRQPALGLAELESLYGAASVVPLAEHVTGLNITPETVDFARLGGSTRLCKVLAELPGTDWNKLEKHLAQTVPQHLQYLPEGKLKLGLSAIGFSVTPAKIIATGLTLKKVIKKAGRSVRLVPNQTAELNTAAVAHNNLTGDLGWELVAIATMHGTTLLAQTVAVQDIASYTLRDRGRPKRDARVGMLPPKLAQIIINLATADTNPLHGAVVLDPFCGTGVVLQEALLMEFSVRGTDLEPRMVNYASKNLDWLNDIYDYLSMDYSVEVGDAANFTWPHIDTIACETYLGRPFTETPSAEILAQTVSEVNLILKKFLQNVATQTKAGFRLCLAVPAWQTAPNQFKHLPLIDQLSDLGYNRVQFKHVSAQNLLYYRPDQIVARELLVITRK